MDSKQANEIIKQDKAAREKLWQAEEAEKFHYRIYWVNPITSLLHKLPSVDIYDDGYGANARLHLFCDCDCPYEEASNAVKQANSGKMGVCIKSRWTTYLVERLS